MNQTPAPSHVMNTYANLPVFLARGQGVWLWDEDGRKYLDGLAGIAVNTLGHNHPRLVAAIADQASKLIHTSNVYKVRLQETLADKLALLSGMDKVFFCNSGLEANEAALKIARKYGHDRGISSPEIIVYDNAFHGRSIATLSATGNAKVQKGFEPLVPGFVRVPLNDIAAINRAADEHPNVVAVFLEAIQGEGGIAPARVEYLKAVRALCDAKGWLLMIDEVQCGIGRTGKWFAHQWAGILPDVMPLAKGLAGGVPIGAVVARGIAADVFGPGNHGTTFGGNPLACRAALETIAVIEDDGLLANAEQVGQAIRAVFSRELSSVAGVLDIRGRGLMLGIELACPCADIPKRALGYTPDYGLLLNVTQERVVRLLPSLVMNIEEATLLAEGVVTIVREFLSQQAQPKAA
ncbi:MAG: aspartate aminotransferase family protein [Burkholderiaceae bacterium]